MEQMRKRLSDAARLAALQLELPLMKNQLEELKEKVSDLKNDRDWAKLTAKNLEEPTFFQRLMGKVAEKQEKAQAEAREASAAYEQAKGEYDALAHRFSALQSELAALSASKEVYERTRSPFLREAEPDAVQELCSMEIEAFRPVAIETLRQIRKALFAARGWMEQEQKSRHYVQQSRRMEYIQLADEYAQTLQTLVAYFPEGSVTLGASITSPGDYIREASMNLSQIDRLNIAIDQSLRVQEQLEAL